MVLEKQLGCNPLTIFNNAEEIPTVTTMVNILYASLLQYNHGIGLDDAFTIFDEYLADGNTATDFLKVILFIIYIKRHAAFQILLDAACLF